MQDEIDVLRVHTWKDWVYTAKLDRIVKSYSLNLEILYQGYKEMYSHLKNSMDGLKLLYKYKFGGDKDPVVKNNYEDRFLKFCLESNEHFDRFEIVSKKLNI